LPLGKAPGGERGRGSHVYDRRPTQSLLGHNRLFALAEQIVEGISVGQESPAHGFHGRRKLRDMADTLEGDPELVNCRLVGPLSESGDQFREASKLLRSKRPERQFRDAVGETWRNTKPGKKGPVLRAVECFEERPPPPFQLLLEPLEEEVLREVVCLVETFELAAKVW
jgi:hypothetical protein